jgi:hypothetical protein
MEWMTSTPPVAYNFAHVPTVVSSPYEYGTGAGPMAYIGGEPPGVPTQNHGTQNPGTQNPGVS